MRGRKPKPAAIRALHHSKKRPYHREEPTITTPEPAPAPKIAMPRGFDRAERAYWDQFAPLLTGAKVLTPADVQTLADYCRACAAIDLRTRRLRVEMRRKTLDNPLVRLLDSQVRGWIEKKTRLATELGLTAISRTRIAWTGHHLPGSVPQPPEQPKSRLAQLQEQAAALRRPLGMK